MPTAWRLTKTRYLATAWDGEGAKRAGGRWNSPGTAVVYASATLSLALVEMLVHVPIGVLSAYGAVRIEFDESLVTPLETADLPEDWRDNPAPTSTRTIGDAWVKAAATVVLRVPSVVVSAECNYLLNPRHPDLTRRVKIGKPMAFPFDPRLRPARGTRR